MTHPLHPPSRNNYVGRGVTLFGRIHPKPGWSQCLNGRVWSPSSSAWLVPVSKWQGLVPQLSSLAGPSA